MKDFQFDEVIDRSGTDAVKLTAMQTIWNRNDLLPLWVADMDFRTAPAVTAAIARRLENGILGYTSAPASYYAAIASWCLRRYRWTIDTDAITYVPGIVPGLGMAIECFTSPGDRILIQPPVYHPFRILTEQKGRTVINAPLRFEEGNYTMDFEELDRKLDGCRLMILCNPHNPGGRVWQPEELNRVAALCQKHNVLVFSDEIHADLTFAPRHHTPFASTGDWARNHSVTFMSPSKAFNMPGLVSSHTLIFDVALREQFRRYLDSGELNMGHVFAYLSVEAAYTEGEEWLTAVLDYIAGNIRYVDTFLRKHIPSIHAVLPQASYLVFLDCRELHLSQEKLNELFADKARLALNDGAMFGQEGTGFMRLNTATPRSVLEEAMHRLEAAVHTL